MNEFENDTSKDDQIVEITDLDPIESTSRFSRMFIALEKRPSLRKQLWRITTASCTVLFILLLLSTFPSIKGLAFSFFSQLKSTHPTTPVTTNATPIDLYVFNAKDEIKRTGGKLSSIIPSATLGPAPQNCPAISKTQGFEYKGAPRVVGSPPVMVIGFGGPDAGLTNFKHAQPPEIGWYTRIILLAETNYAGTVTFRGGNLRNGYPIWFGMKQHDQGPITTFTMIPLNSGISDHLRNDEGWGLSSATLYIPRAGCYFLMATWPEGAWVVFFSAGR
jgi:hypothetical protein